MKITGKYLLWLNIYTVVIILLHALLYFLLPGLQRPDFTIFIYCILYVSTLGSFLMIKNVKKLESKIFVQFAILTIVMRLLFFAIMSGMIILLDREGYIPNMLLFSILYLLYTIFDIIMTIKNTQE